MSRIRLTALVLASLLALSVANAQEQWAVQVVALRDFREAQSTAADLRLLGLDAYTEFAMLNSQQWVRVRIGCFGSREAADAMAEALRTRITADAQAVERGNATATLHCTHETVGFLNEYDWRLLDGSGPVTFSVTVAGVEATVAHDGSRWRVVQESEAVGAPAVTDVAVESAVTASTEPSGRTEFVQHRIGGVEFVRLADAVWPQVVCPGELVATVADVAIVVRGEHVVACHHVVIGPQEAAR